MIRRPPISTLFPYTTLSRSDNNASATGPAATAPPMSALAVGLEERGAHAVGRGGHGREPGTRRVADGAEDRDRKSTRLNSSHAHISYGVFCLEKKKKKHSHE